MEGELKIGTLMYSSMSEEECVITGKMFPSMGVECYYTSIGPRRIDDLEKVEYKRRKL